MPETPSDLAAKVVCTSDFECGQVVALDLILWCHPIDVDQNYYTFTCPCCDQACRRLSSRDTTALLMVSGFPCRSQPPEREPRDGSPVNTDDLLDVILDINAHGVRIHEPKYPAHGSYDPTTTGENE